MEPTSPTSDLPAERASESNFKLFDESRVRARLRETLSRKELTPLEDAWRCEPRPGVYLLYFHGDAEHPIYGQLATAERWPVYVGRTFDLQRRLGEHLRSIYRTHNLRLGDFSYIVIPTNVHETGAVEELLIDEYQPVWNRKLEGFGSKDRLRRRNGITPWDHLHPGRTPRKGRNTKTRKELIEEIRDHLTSTLPRSNRKRRRRG